MSVPAAVEHHYSTGLTRPNIERALIDAGRDPARIEPADLAMLEDFHTMGRLATAALGELAEVQTEDAVLDAGTGIGGSGEIPCRPLRMPGHSSRSDGRVLRDGAVAR
jgi:hypothetical protein